MRIRATPPAEGCATKSRPVLWPGSSPPPSAQRSSTRRPGECYNSAAGGSVQPAGAFLLSERSVLGGRLRPRPGRGSAAQSTHRELDSLPGGLRDPPGCTGDPVPVPSCSACSGRPVPHLSPDLKHSLTRTSPHLKRTRTPSCAFHSNSTSTRSLAACA